MKRLTICMLICLACLQARAARVWVDYLVISLRSGAEVRYALKDSPKITFQGDSLTIDGTLMMCSDVARWTFVTEQEDDGRPEVEINLSPGWNWISQPMLQDVAVETFQPSAERIVCQTDEVILDIQFGWIGGISSIQPQQAYKVKMTEPRSVVLIDDALASNEIPLHKGWNWVGYPSTQTETIAFALANTEVQEGDVVYSHQSFAEYSDGRWQGTLAEMIPGHGYMYKSVSAKTLKYSQLAASPGPHNARQENALPPLGADDVDSSAPWTADAHAYPSMMALVASLFRHDGLLAADGTWIGAFADEECRGVGRLKEGRLLMSIYGQGGETITFRVMHGPFEGEYEGILETLRFDADMHGSISRPLPLHLNGITTGIGSLASEADGQMYYQVDGCLISTPSRGFYIVTDRSGKARKLFHR